MQFDSKCSLRPSSFKGYSYVPNSSCHAREGKISAFLAHGQQRTSSIINEIPKIKKPMINVELVVTKLRG
jgi:hypothetical protein